MDTKDRIWVGDWRTKVRSRVHSVGSETIGEYLARYPAEPYHKVARRLGEDIAAMQLVFMQFEEAQESAAIREAARDCLARELADKLKRGWGHKVHLDFNRANAFSSWLVHVKEFAPQYEKNCHAVWDALAKLPPGDTWVPTGPADSTLASAFEAGWPVSQRGKVKRQQYGLLCPKCTAVLSIPCELASEMVCHLCGEQFELV
jgi:hypothetical protein